MGSVCVIFSILCCCARSPASQEAGSAEQEEQRTMVRAQVWILTKHFDGFPEDSNFELKEEELPEPKHGGRTKLSVNECRIEHVIMSTIKQQEMMFPFQRCFWRLCFSVLTRTWGEQSWKVVRVVSEHQWTLCYIVNSLTQKFDFKCNGVTSL